MKIYIYSLYICYSSTCSIVCITNNKIKNSFGLVLRAPSFNILIAMNVMVKGSRILFYMVHSQFGKVLLNKNVAGFVVYVAMFVAHVALLIVVLHM